MSPELLARARLIAAGLADHLLPEPGDPRPDLALLLSLLRLPPAPQPPRAPGDVLVLVGPLAAALPLGLQLAQRSDESDALVVASSRAVPDTVPEACRARTPEEAGAAVFKRRAKGKTTVVVVDSQAPPAFVQAVTAGVRPEARWGVVPAAWSVGQVRQLVERTGPLDAIALHGFLATDRPARLIGGQWPISHIDGWAASPLSITARLVEAVMGLAEQAGGTPCADD